MDQGEAFAFAEPAAKKPELKRNIKEDDDSVIYIDNHRNPRPCLSKLGPLATWLFLVLANVSFIAIEVLPWVGYFQPEPNPLVEPASIKPVYVWIKFALFQLLVIVTFWAHLRTFASDPGFIPRGYNYNIKQMTPANVSLFNYIVLSKEKSVLIESAKKLLTTRISKKDTEDSKKHLVVIPQDKRLSMSQ